ncbi:MAG TPA: patatin-like phospholipase family protein [Bryobacteraceae bacterium]|nr:patatin-like phospholipase family protein [Bryobacteraceae bacterium]
MAIGAQQPGSLPAPPSGKRLGIAFAGGGAKGLAHIGVLQWLHEHRIPIHAVAGASMGGLVGGLYSSGRTSEEIRQFVDNIDWDQMLGPSPGYADLTIRRKEDQRAFPATLELGLRNGQPQLPAGINPGHQVELLLARIGLPYAGIPSFDDLPTPFRCVAADLRSGKKVVLRNGQLAIALRATMSLPAIFSPVAQDDMLLVDGGIVDNLPVEVVRGMNVDSVVAVDLGLASVPADRVFSLIEVANRSIDIMIRNRTLESLQSADIVLTPDVASLSTLDFKDQQSIIQKGYMAAESAHRELIPFAVSESEWEAYMAARRAKSRLPKFTPQFLELSGALPGYQRRFTRALENLAGKSMDGNQLETRLTHLTGLGPYAAAGYIQAVQSGKEGLAVRLRKKSYGPPFLRPLVILDSGQAGASSFTIAARMTAFDFLTRNSELRADISFGRLNSVATEFYQFLGSSGLFAAPRLFASQDQQLIVNEGARLAEYRVRRTGAGFDIGYNFGRFSELRAGIEVARLRADVQIGLPILPRAAGTEQLFTGRWRLNTLNSGAIPTRGLFTEVEGNWNFKTPSVYFLGQNATDPGKYGQGFGQLVYARTFQPKWSGMLRLSGGSTFQGTVQPFSEFRLGGPMRLSALEVGESRGANFGYGSVLGLRLLRDSSSLALGRIYGMVGYETGDAFDSRLQLFHAGTGGLMAETAMGVLTVGFSYGERGRHSLFFSIGRTFDSGVRNPLQLR